MNKIIIAVVLFCLVLSVNAVEPLFDMKEMYDESTLDVKVLTEWHEVDGAVKTRQKIINILVGELWPGQDLRVPVRLVVPADRKAKGFYLTGSFGAKGLGKDLGFKEDDIKAELIKGGYGIVETTMGASYPSKELVKQMEEKFTETMNPRVKLGLWGWAATYMRTITAAQAETEYFEKGKIAMTGRSKGGATATIVLNVDKRTTAVHAAASPIGASPMRMHDTATYESLDKYYLEKKGGAKPKKVKPGLFPNMDQSFALGGTYGLNFTKRFLQDGEERWKDLQALSARVAPSVFVSENREQLKARNVDMLFYPGTHDYICYDIAWIGANCPDVPIYLKANCAHSKRGLDVEMDEQNKTAFLLAHFFEDEMEPLLEPPVIKTKLNGKKSISVTVTFKPGSKSETGSIYWMYNRPPDGTTYYLKEKFPEENQKKMKKVSDDVWAVDIELEAGKSTIDLFTSHRKTVKYKSTTYPTYLSSPYTRVSL